MLEKKGCHGTASPHGAAKNECNIKHITTIQNINTSNWRLIAAFFESDAREGNCRFLNTKSKIWIKMDQTKYIMWVKQ